jgi:hypothetical protein
LVLLHQKVAVQKQELQKEQRQRERERQRAEILTQAQQLKECEARTAQ